MITFGAVVRRGGGWLPLIALGGLVGSLGMLALPEVLGHSVDALVSGHGSGRWLALAGGLIALGIVFELSDAYTGAACIAGTTAWPIRKVVPGQGALGPIQGTLIGASAGMRV